MPDKIHSEVILYGRGVMLKNQFFTSEAKPAPHSYKVHPMFSDCFERFLVSNVDKSTFSGHNKSNEWAYAGSWCGLSDNPEGFILEDSVEGLEMDDKTVLALSERADGLGVRVATKTMAEQK